MRHPGGITQGCAPELGWGSQATDPVNIVAKAGQRECMRVCGSVHLCGGGASVCGLHARYLCVVCLFICMCLCLWYLRGMCGE